MNDFEQKLLSMLMGMLLVVSLLAAAREAAGYKLTADNAEVAVGKGKPLIMIDAGHGGDDPGKVGVNGALEKDLNLEVALLLKQFLEAEDFRVALTRDSDAGLYDEDAPNKKVQDMKRRIELIEDADPVITVSIHQNSYPEEYVHGAQVFYYTGSAAGKRLAQRIQEELVSKVDPENKRQVKENDSYYLLKKTGTPIVIVECGFLSNPDEAQKLCTDSYKERLAWAVHMGIVRFMNEKNTSKE